MYPPNTKVQLASSSSLSYPLWNGFYAPSPMETSNTGPHNLKSEAIKLMKSSLVTLWWLGDYLWACSRWSDTRQTAGRRHTGAEDPQEGWPDSRRAQAPPSSHTPPLRKHRTVQLHPTSEPWWLIRLLSQGNYDHVRTKIYCACRFPHRFFMSLWLGCGYLLNLFCVVAGFWDKENTKRERENYKL